MSDITTFTHLHTHTSNSLLDGIGKPEENVKRAAAIGQQAISITDHGTLAGYYEFQKACDKYGVKPIFGNEFYFVPDRHIKGLSDEEKEELTKEQQKEEVRKRQETPHLIILAETQEGLQNLFKLNYFANKEGFYGKPRIDFDLLEQHKEGLIVSTACIISPFSKAFFRGQVDLMMETFDRLFNIVGKDNIFVELQPHEKFSMGDGNEHAQNDYNHAMVNLILEEYDVRPVLTNDVHYPEKKHAGVHAFMLNVNTNGKYDETSCHNLYIASEYEMIKFWEENGHRTNILDDVLYDGIESTKLIASRCNAVLDINSMKEPKFETPKKYSSNYEYISDLIFRGFKEKYDKGLIPEERGAEYIERIKTELDMISSRGYVDYFLITRDFMQYAHEQDILCSPGRGSASGAILCWLLGITQLDPIKYDLFFERFLNPERVKAPDIDNDFQDNRRDEVKEYVARRWGESNIASCANYNRYTANTLFREVCKHKGYDHKEVNEVAKTIVGHVSLNKDVATIQEIMESNKTVRDFVQNMPSEDREEFLLLMDAMVGNPKNLGVSAAGVIVSSQPLYELMSLRKGTNNEAMVTEWQINELGNMNFLKIDMLGISTLSHVKEVCDKAGISIDYLYNMPLDRELLSPEEQVHYDNAYKLLNDGDTQGVFQFGGANITRCLQNIKPFRLEDIAAATAIYRPGVIQMGATDKFIKRRNGEEEATNDIHPEFDDILSPTENIMIYQEQFIQMFNRMGLDFGKADMLRRYAEDLDHAKCESYLEEHLYAHPDKMTMPEEEIRKIAKPLIENSGYLFNKSHAISYSILSYWTAYVKARFPAEYAEVMLNHHIGDFDNLAIDLSMAAKMLDNPKLSLGSINDFSRDFKVTKDQITIGLRTVKGVGDSNIKKINERLPMGGWLTYQEFIVDNLAYKMISGNDLKILVNLGFFDDIPVNGSNKTMSRKTLVALTTLIYDFVGSKKKEQKEFMKVVFGDEDTHINDILYNDNMKKLVKQFGLDFEDEYTEEEMIKIEMDHIGFRISVDQEKIDIAKKLMRENDIPNISEYESDKQYYYGMVTSYEELKTKKGKPYYNVRMEDGSSFRIWDNKLKYIKDMIVPNTIVMVKLNSDSFGRSLSWDKYSFVGQEQILQL